MLPTDTAGASFPRVVGKFLQTGSERFLIKGVAYGTFAPDADATSSRRCRESQRTSRSCPVRRQHGTDLHGAAAELHGRGGRARDCAWWRACRGRSHVAFLDDRKLARAVRRDIVREVRRLAEHPATLLVAVGNEIPSGVVRWHGAARIERFLRTCTTTRSRPRPDVLLTYVNYPPTDYLDLPFFDVCAFNVYLHRGDDLRAYVAHLQVVAGNRPLLLAEGGADSLPRGRRGAGGPHRDAAPHRVRGGRLRRGRLLVDRRLVARRARGRRLALRADRRAAPAQAGAGRRGARIRGRGVPARSTPGVAAHLGADLRPQRLRHADECLRSVGELDYPDYEVIVVNDGSTDDTGKSRGGTRMSRSWTRPTAA